MLASESYPWGIANARSELEPTRKSPRISTNPSSSTALQGSLPTNHPSPSNIQDVFRRRFFKTWMDMVAFYTKCGLSDKRDKLPAISEIAEELKRSSERYLPSWFMETRPYI